MAETLNEYSNGFDVDAYLTSRFADPRCQEDESLVRNFALQNIHDYTSGRNPRLQSKGQQTSKYI